MAVNGERTKNWFIHIKFDVFFAYKRRCNTRLNQFLRKCLEAACLHCICLHDEFLHHRRSAVDRTTADSSFLVQVHGNFQFTFRTLSTIQAMHVEPSTDYRLRYAIDYFLNWIIDQQKITSDSTCLPFYAVILPSKGVWFLLFLLLQQNAHMCNNNAHMFCVWLWADRSK